MRNAVGGPGATRRPQDETNSLTGFEIEGLEGDLSLADGHAGHELSNVVAAFERPGIVEEARRRGPIVTAEDMVAQWSLLAGEPSAPQAARFIAPTASVSILVVAGAAELLGLSVVLVDPTFDNLSQILRRHVALTSVFEAQLHEDPRAVIERMGRGTALFLVDPNNPTGTTFDDATLDTIIEACAHRGVALIIDCTFRFFGSPGRTDLIGRLQRSGVEFVVIEDTGKTWPTLEVKASATFYSPSWQTAIETRFQEIFLLQPPLVMQAFADLFRIERAAGFPRPLHALVAERRTRLRALVAGTRLRVADESRASTLPVEWLDISDTGLTDVALVREVAARTGVHLLPGRPFYWSRGDLQPTNRIRVSLLRQQHVFDQALARLLYHFDGAR